MKTFTTASIFAAVMTGAMAQTTTSAASYTTEVYEECYEATSTVTGTITQTYCGECEMMSSMSAMSEMVTTVWTTTYSEFCPTGLQPYTVTVTESCSGMPTWSPGSSGYVPQGFTTTYASCDVCGATPISTVLTVPVGSTPVPMPAATAMPVATATPTVAPTAGATPAATAGRSDAPAASAAPSTPSDVPAVSAAPSAPLWSNNTMSTPTATGNAAQFTGAASSVRATSWLASLAGVAFVIFRLL